MPGTSPTKKSIAWIIIASVFFSLVVNLLFGRWLAVKVSTWPLLNRWKLVSPMAPIVINNREEIRVTDPSDPRRALDLLRPKLSLVVSKSGQQILPLGSTLNLTADGAFVTIKSAIANQKMADLLIKLDDGTIVQVTAIIPDSATELVILKTNAQNIATANLASSKDAAAGKYLVFVEPGLQNFSGTVQTEILSLSQDNNLEVKNSDYPGRTFKVAFGPNLPAGAAVADSDGNVLGLWDSGKIISSDVIRDLINNYVNNHGQILRPQFGFSYRIISQAENRVLAEPQGAKVISVQPGSPAQKAGLQAGDIIQSWNQKDLNENDSLESLSQSIKPGEVVEVKIARGKTQMNLNLIAGQLK